jgi:DNA-binding NtrC family response regulator
MRDDSPTSNATAQTSRSENEVAKATEEWFLVRALECEAPTSGSARHSLRDVTSVEINRGPKHSSLRHLIDGQRVLRLELPDRKLSSRHARLTKQGSGWFLEDLDSTNGSWVGDARITSLEVGDGAFITLGRTLFLLRCALMERRIAPDISIEPTSTPTLRTLNPLVEDSFTRLGRVAPSPLPVLLLGESGTGKEVLARAIHELSKRPGPFVPVNCGAIPSTLVEAQLFGHVKGAFTGAAKSELGFVRSASFGTLFLDEIGDLPASSQVALLRVMQSGEVTPLGSSHAVHTDVRIVAATHRDVKDLMDTGVFRSDLYARLAGFVNQLPPLRDRREDLGLLIGTLLARHAPNADELRIRPEAARALFAYHWPLNVRELEQCLAAAVVLADDGVIALEHLPDALRKPGQPLRSKTPSPTRPPESLDDEEQAIHAALVESLTETKGNVTETAKRMGKARQQIQRWMRRFGVTPEGFR